ncbi:MAG: hypothetical protein MI725_15355, partial [Pirellulales bacterium]|nr:hypothetical protein [Pirellulales bacterium]
MWAYIIRRLLYNIPVFLAIVFLVMWLLSHRDPVPGLLGKNAEKADIEAKRQELGLDRPLIVRYADLLQNMFLLKFDQEMWTQPGMTVGEQLRKAIIPSLALTLPALAITSLISVTIGMISAFSRGTFLD